MSRYISELLGAREPLFSAAIAQLEQASGNTSVDLRLTAEILAKSKQKIRELGLDPKDTTAPELYAALLNLAQKHDEFLLRRIGLADTTSIESITDMIGLVTKRLGISKEAWVIKHSVAKRMFKNQPPRRAMRLLRYRSLDSMLKREPVENIFAAIHMTESEQWKHNFIRQYKTLTPADFEIRDIDVVVLDQNHWKAVAENYTHQNNSNLLFIKEIGAVYILPLTSAKTSGICIALLPAVLHYINEIRMYSAFFKLQQVRADFGEIIWETIIADPSNHAMMAGHNIHWRVIHRYYGGLEERAHPEIFEPHVQPEDLDYRKVEEVLYRLEPALHFWHDMDYVAVRIDDQIVSFNLMDIAVSYLNSLNFEHRSTQYYKESLWNELFVRYMGQSALERQVLKQLDNEIVEPETFGLVRL